MRTLRASAAALAVIASLFTGLALNAKADYADGFDAYADGTVPPGWVATYGPGVMGITAGAFAHRSTFFNNFCYYAYTGEIFGEGTFDLDVNVSTEAWNNVVLWRWDGAADGGQGSMQLVFRTSPLIPPTEHTRLYEFLPGGESVLAETPGAFTGLHHVTVKDQGSRVLVLVDGVLVFDVPVPTPLPAGYFGVNPGDWGSGGWYDNAHLTSGQPTPVHSLTWAGIKSLYAAYTAR